MVFLLVCKFLPDSKSFEVVACFSDIDKAYSLLKKYQDLQKSGFLKNFFYCVEPLNVID